VIEPVIWFKQTIGHACGSIGVLHSVVNGPAKFFIQPDSTFAKIRSAAIPLKIHDRAKMLYDNKEFEIAHQSVAEIGDTTAPSAAEGDRYVIPSLICLISPEGMLIYYFRLGQHFISFIKEDGRLWELEGSRVSSYPFPITLHHNMLKAT
jgi:ubiquitin carboxyl-terminal hydrolase L3